MAGLTAIELGADTCTMVRTAVRGTDVRVLGVETLDPAAFPGTDAFIGALRHARRTKKLARRARVVLWGLPDGVTAREPGVAPLLLPLKRAGFRIDRAVSPCNALAALARVRAPRGDAAVVWLAINRGGVAIAVVRPGTLLHAHEFPWDSSVGATGSQARLLQRYSLVAFLAPEVRRAIEVAAAKGTRVEAVVTCGNLADLRSLTMPLIEELDLEVETLDSFDGLTLKPSLRDGLADAAPALRIACAGAIARASRARVEHAQRFTGRALFRAAALVVAASAIGWLWLGSRAQSRAVVVPSAAQSRSAVPPATPPQAIPPPSQQRAPVVTPAPQAQAQAPARVVTTPAPAPKPLTPQASAPAAPLRVTRPPVSTPVAPTLVAPKPVVPMPVAPKPSARVVTPPPANTRPAPVTTAQKPAPARPQATVAAPPPVKPAPTPAATPPQPSAPPMLAERVRADKPDAGPPAPRRGDAAGELLKDALPHISTILVSEDRRFAVLDGRTVAVGDTVGQRVVTAIEPRAVVLREPSGVQIRVGLGGRFLGVERSGR